MKKYLYYLPILLSFFFTTPLLAFDVDYINATTTTASYFNGLVGIGASDSSTVLHVQSPGNKSAGKFRLDTPATNWSSIYPVFEFVNAYATNNNPVLLQFSDNASGVGSNGFGTTFTDRTNHYADTFFWNKNSLSGAYNQSMFVRSTGVVEPNYGLFVKGSTDIVQTTIKGYSTQTNDIFTVQKSDATSYFKVTGTGKVAINTATPSETLDVNGNIITLAIFATSTTATSTFNKVNIADLYINGISLDNYIDNYMASTTEAIIQFNNNFIWIFGLIIFLAGYVIMHRNLEK